jgi:hypothetical protein
MDASDQRHLPELAGISEQKRISIGSGPGYLFAAG